MNDTPAEPSEANSAPDDETRTSWLAMVLKPTREERRKILIFQLWVVTLVLQGLWLLAAMAPVSLESDTSAAVGWFWAVLLMRTFSFHYGLGVSLAMIIALALKQWKLALSGLPLVLITWLPWASSFVPRSPPEKLGPPLKIASANLLMINKTTKPIIEELKGFDADIMVFQEYSPRWHGALKQAFSQSYPHIIYVVRRDSFGAAIYSRRPFLNKQPRIEVGETKVPTFRVEFDHGGRRFTLYNIHTLPPRRMSYVREQRYQFRDLATKYFPNDKGPTLVCGDFNWTEHSWFHAQMLAQGFVEGHSQAGSGRGDTWPVLKFSRYLPGIRLDHIYARGAVHFLDHRAGQGLGSDHRPILATVAAPR